MEYFEIEKELSKILAQRTRDKELTQRNFLNHGQSKIK